MPEAPVLQLWQQYRDLGLSVSEQLRDDLSGPPGDAPVRALDDVERDATQPQPLPGADEILGADRVEVEVDGAQLVGSERPRVLDRARGGDVEAVEEDEHDVAAKGLGLCRPWSV